MLKDDGLAGTQKDDGMSWGEDVRGTENCGVWCRHKGYSGKREGHLGGQTLLVATRVSQTGRESSCTCSPALCKAPFFPGSP